MSTSTIPLWLPLLPGLALGLNVTAALAQAQTASQVQGPGSYLFWYLSRATGLTAYVLLFVDVWLGVLLWGKTLGAE